MLRPIGVTLFALAVVCLGTASVSAQSCSLLSAADVEKISGVHVQDIPFNSKPGAGGKCANFAIDNGRLFLGVSQLEAASYSAEVASVPQAVYPQRENLQGVGDEAVLMKGSNGSLRYLVARKRPWHRAFPVWAGAGRREAEGARHPGTLPLRRPQRSAVRLKFISIFAAEAPLASRQGE
jgi:hypothetical protein